MKKLLTDEERKAPLIKIFKGYVFDTCMDLSSGIKVYPETISRGWKSREIAMTLFTEWWSTMVYKHLTKFPGFSTVKWIHLDSNPNPFLSCSSRCIHKKFISYGGPTGNYLAKCLCDGSIKNDWNNRCFSLTQRKLDTDSDEGENK